MLWMKYAYAKICNKIVKHAAHMSQLYVEVTMCIFYQQLSDGLNSFYSIAWL